MSYMTHDERNVAQLDAGDAMMNLSDAAVSPARKAFFAGEAAKYYANAGGSKTAKNALEFAQKAKREALNAASKEAGLRLMARFTKKEA